jgi:hypothetical protein
MKYYTYKITFKDLPGYFYYGSHKDNGKPYFGSPVTWARLWLLFEPEVQVLQWYYTAEEVYAAECSIILATWKDKYSLNEAVGARASEDICRKNGHKTTISNLLPNCIANGTKTGPENAAYLLPYCSENGKKSMTPERASEFGNQTIGLCNKHVNTIRSRKLNGIEAVKSGMGIFSDEYKDSEKCKTILAENTEKMLLHPNTKAAREKCKRPVLCVETGVVYPSVRGAERESGVCRVNIRNSIRTGHRAGGYHWEYV